MSELSTTDSDNSTLYSIYKKSKRTLNTRLLEKTVKKHREYFSRYTYICAQLIFKYDIMVHTIGDNNSLFNQFIAEIRDVNVQNDPLRFRRNLERVGEIFAYEISKTFNYSEKDVQTPLGTAKMNLPEDEVVVASILRAGLPLHNGLLNYFDRSENAFISAYRKYNEKGEFEIKFEYISSPSIDGKVVILADPMLATGSSMELAYKALFTKGTPKHVHIVSVIASAEGVEFVKEKLAGENITLWMGAIDPELNSKSYIVPGCGDAGDLAFGAKL